MTSSFIILEQIDPPSNEPFRIVETFICSEGYRTRVLGERFATLERAQGEVEALKAALAKTLAALPTETAPDAPVAEADYPEAPWPASARTNAPSEAMIDAGLKVDWSNEDERGTVINVWYAMNAARRHEAPAEGAALEQIARQLAFVHAYHSARKNCSNPNATHETWAALSSKQSERDWKRFLPDAKLMQEYAHPAAPSADKLRKLVGASEDILSALSALSVAGKPIASLDTKLRDAINAMVPALAALKA